MAKIMAAISTFENLRKDGFVYVDKTSCGGLSRNALVGRLDLGTI